MKTEQLKIECSSCDATGLYKGMGEGGKSAVVCHYCDGTGFVLKKFKLFSHRKVRSGIKRVFKDSIGYGHTDKDYTTEEGITIEFSKGGCTYEEWLSGEQPKPVKDLYCPYLWTRQALQNKDKNDLYKSKCSAGLSLGNISDCKNFKTKSKCWEIYEEK